MRVAEIRSATGAKATAASSTQIAISISSLSPRRSTSAPLCAKRMPCVQVIMQVPAAWAIATTRATSHASDLDSTSPLMPAICATITRTVQVHEPSR
eukprot:scaffold32053_cov59-Phaeocystis_antarctica.AAC.3